ncbi:hypothetical protein AC1031_002605 [Aphanomyces cochlioides]|nr:hypothetical protein AC1031_002605 [Aphanomyces cochlioides]
MKFIFHISMSRGGTTEPPVKRSDGTESILSPVPIYVDLQTSRGQASSTGQQPSHPRQTESIVSSLLSNLHPFKLTKEMRLMIQAAAVESDLHSGNTTLHQRNGTIDLQECTTSQLYDSLCLAHFNRNGGPLRPGGALSLWSRSCFGLLLSSLFVGFMFGALPSTLLRSDKRIVTVAPLLAPIYPIYNIHAPFMLFPASLRFVIGLLSDFFPIWSYRRKSYMVLGWALSGISLLVGAILVSTKASDDVSVINLLAACLGITMADVAGEGLMVEFAQRETLLERGRVQAVILGSKYLGAALSQCYLAALQGHSLIEWTSKDSTYQGLLFSLASMSFVPIPFIAFVLAETHGTTAPLVDRLVGLWNVFQSKALAYVMLFSFVFSLSVHAGAGQTSTFKREILDIATEQSWLYVNIPGDESPLPTFLVVAAGLVAFGLPMILGTKLVVKVSWTSTMVWTTLAVSLISALHTSWTTYDTVRDEWFWFGLLVILQVPSGLRFLVTLFPLVELSVVGFEATMYSLVLSMQLVAIPVSTALFSILEKPLRVGFGKELLGNKMTDAELVSRVAELRGFTYLLGFIVLFSLMWLPSQKIDAQVWRKFGGSSRTVGYILVGLWWIMLTLLIVMGTLSIYPLTWACSPALGGSGCS